MNQGRQRGTVTAITGIWTVVTTGRETTLVTVSRSRGARVGQQVTILWSLSGWYVK